VTARRGIAVFGASLEAMAVAAAAADRAGFHSVWTSELYNRSATATLAALAPRTSACVLGSGIMYGVVGAVSEAMVDELAVAGTPDEVAEQLRRFDGVVDEVVLSPPTFRVTPERVAENLATLTAHCA
jgi:alkanesulfonate monooxygenase SsuD/methylene tetrahydromethanopterin reductase-like flavin-dependent oxidoreductase (luciferase family)